MNCMKAFDLFSCCGELTAPFLLSIQGATWNHDKQHTPCSDRRTGSIGLTGKSSVLTWSIHDGIRPCSSDQAFFDEFLHI